MSFSNLNLHVGPKGCTHRFVHWNAIRSVQVALVHILRVSFELVAPVRDEVRRAVGGIRYRRD